MYSKNGMWMRVIFTMIIKTSFLMVRQTTTDNENIGTKESYYFGGSKIVYLKETKPIIIVTEEAVILEEAITKEKCNNDRTEVITQERSPPVVPGYPMPYSQTLEEIASGYESDIEINTHSADEEKTDGMYVGVAQKPTGFSIKSILNDESDDPSTNNRKRKHDLEINEELRDEVYYKLLPSILD
ncbi:hypothetical protein C1646_710332 [Rhizophagus diaphanus]|nr:hypothetical protein C1646_710332 [Rhizophagus diaphanus] [Rhizophagus sp. MUCL 43196]